MQKKARNEMVKAFEAELKELVRGLLEALMREERAMYLETHPTSANGYYTRDLLTLVGPVEDLKVPRVREGDFHPRILPYRKRASLELSEIILALYAVGVSTRKISHFLEGIYGAFYSPQSISRLIQVTEEEVKAWRERPRDSGGGRGSRAKPARTVGHGLSQDRGTLGKPRLMPFLRFYATLSPSEGIPYHQPSGAVGQRSKEANQSGRGLL